MFFFFCADSKIHDATDWNICQGIEDVRANSSHKKPSFHLKHQYKPPNTIPAKRDPVQDKEAVRMPTPNTGGNHDRRRIYLNGYRRAVQAGEFDNYSSGTSNESPSTKAGNGVQRVAEVAVAVKRKEEKGEEAMVKSYTISLHPHPPQVCKHFVKGL
ncbi:hypothetical protein NC652_019965 [Populus alba x Populus x berolinensis]|nr:hypothetical protein NC652_019965 [Populus alba x Populus x berolinensis]